MSERTVGRCIKGVQETNGVMFMKETINIQSAGAKTVPRTPDNINNTEKSTAFGV